jgi:hypothetical protein
LGSGVPVVVPLVGDNFCGAWPGSFKVGLLLIGHCLWGYDLAVSVEGVQGLLQKLHADDRGARPLMLLQDDGFTLAVVDDLAEAIVSFGQLDRGEIRKIPFAGSDCHSRSPARALANRDSPDCGDGSTWTGVLAKIAILYKIARTRCAIPISSKSVDYPVVDNVMISFI